MYRPKIFIAASDPALTHQIKTALNREGYVVAGEAADAASTLRVVRSQDVDLVILDTELAGVGGLEVAKIIEEDRLAPILLLTPTWQREYVAKARDYWVFAFLTKPVNEQALIPAVESAMLNFEKMVALEKEVARLKDTLATRKLVERAKGILMETLGLSEQEAFRRIQRQSMDRSLSMRAVAEAIIMTNEMSKQR